MSWIVRCNVGHKYLAEADIKTGRSWWESEQRMALRFFDRKDAQAVVDSVRKNVNAIQIEGLRVVRLVAPCPVQNYCSRHGFIHGGEAEELRSSIESLLSEYRRTVPVQKLVDLLDSVDARDSLAFQERTSHPISTVQEPK